MSSSLVGDVAGIITQNCLFASKRYNNIQSGGLQTPTETLRMAGNLHKAGQAVKKIDSSVVQNNVGAAKNFLNGTSGVSKFAKGAIKISEVASKASTPLIIGSAAARVLQADKEVKLDALLNESMGVSGMFLAEKMAKSSKVEGFIEKSLMKYVNKIPSKGKMKYVKAAIIPVAKALTFVAASISGYKIGKNVGVEITGVNT